MSMAVTVVVIVVSGHVLYSVYFDFRSTRTLAASAVASVRGPRLNTSLTAAQDQTQRLVDSLLHAVVLVGLRRHLHKK